MHTSYNYTYTACINIKQTSLHQQHCQGCAQNIALITNLAILCVATLYGFKDSKCRQVLNQYFMNVEDANSIVVRSSIKMY